MVCVHVRVCAVKCVLRGVGAVRYVCVCCESSV